jgi:chromosome condensin MukBEF ATPase and DNA-binding subunit MukB
MIWNLYADNKDLKAKRAADHLEYKKLRSDYDNCVHAAGMDRRSEKETALRRADRYHRESQDLVTRIADLEAALDAKSTLALTAQIRVDQLERAAREG